MCADIATLFYYSSQDISGMISWGTGEVPFGKEQTPAEHILQAEQMEGAVY